MMIKEQYISLDTARMLKDASFNVPCRRHYTKSGSTWETAVPETIDDSKSCTWFPCPTQALAARWLREVHRIVVDVAYIPPHVGRDVWQYFVGGMDDMVLLGDYEPSDRKYETYEEAMETGLQEAIKLIKEL